jgi:hypothetical protein
VPRVSSAMGPQRRKSAVPRAPLVSVEPVLVEKGEASVGLELTQSKLAGAGRGPPAAGAFLTAGQQGDRFGCEPAKCCSEARSALTGEAG